MTYNNLPASLIGKHILAIDYGQKFTGLANYKVNSDPFVLTYGRIQYQSDEQLIDEIHQVIEEEFIDILVLGIPYFTDGTESTMTKTIKAFGEKLEKLKKLKKLKEQSDLDIYFQDETLSSYEAQERMKNDPRYNFQVDLTKIDAVAASIILEDFLKSFSS